MAKNYFPAQDQSYTYLQTNRSDDLGSLWSTMGVDLQSNLANLRVAPRMLVAANTAGLPNLGIPTAFLYAENQLYAVCGARIFQSLLPNSGWAENVDTGVPTNCDANSDLAQFDGNVYVTAGTSLLRQSGPGNSWSSQQTISSGGTSHAMTRFEVFNRLYFVSDTDLVESIDTSNNLSDGSYELDLSDTTYGGISCMVSNSNSIWIGTIGTNSNSGQFANVLQWDGISSGLTKSYELRARYVLAMCVYEDIPYLMDSDGILQKFNGYTFEEIGRLPFVNKPPRSSFIARNGMTPTKNGTILINVMNLNTGSTSTYQENIPSGVWEWSEDFGFTHKFSPSYTPGSGTATITDFGQNIISAPGAILDVSQLFPNTAARNGSIIAGATYFTDASTTTNGIFVDDSNNTIIKKGYFVSTWFFSREVQDKWERLWAIFRRLLTSNDSIVFKYRVTEEDPTYADITWVNTTSFTTTTNPSAYWTSGVGGEVEVLQGTGSGSCAHITNIVNNSGTYTVTLDTAITGVTTGTAKVRFQKWIKLNPTITGQVKSWEQLAIGASNPRIQIKGCFTFTGNGEFYRFALFSNSDITVTA